MTAVSAWGASWGASWGFAWGGEAVVEGEWRRQPVVKKRAKGRGSKPAPEPRRVPTPTPYEDWDAVYLKKQRARRAAAVAEAQAEEKAAEQRRRVARTAGETRRKADERDEEDYDPEANIFVPLKPDDELVMAAVQAVLDQERLVVVAALRVIATDWADDAGISATTRDLLDQVLTQLAA